MSALIHYSDCAVNNGPAYPAGPCDCGMLEDPRDARIAELEMLIREVRNHRVGNMPTQGYLRDTDASRLALHRLFNAVK